MSAEYGLFTIGEVLKKLPSDSMMFLNIEDGRLSRIIGIMQYADGVIDAKIDSPLGPEIYEVNKDTFVIVAKEDLSGRKTSTVMARTRKFAIPFVQSEIITHAPHELSSPIAGMYLG